MLSIDEAIAHAREVAKAKRKEMQCKTCKLFAKSDLHPLQGYCRKNKFRSIEIDSWRKVCSEYVPKEMCKCAEEHEQLAEWLEELKAYREIGTVEGYKNAIECYTKEYTIRKSNVQYDKAVDDFVHECDKYCGFYNGENKNITREDILKIAEQLKEQICQ